MESLGFKTPVIDYKASLLAFIPSTHVTRELSTLVE